MAGRHPEQTTEMVLAALSHVGQRAVIATGAGGLVSTAVPDSVLLIKEVPHDWLFPQVAAVIHHGGAGTTAAALRAGKPMVICPFFGDQPFWGQRISELGVGPEPLPQKHLTTEKLGQALRRVITDEEMRKRATHLGTIIRAEHGVERAIQAIHQYLKHGKDEKSTVLGKEDTHRV